MVDCQVCEALLGSGLVDAPQSLDMEDWIDSFSAARLGHQEIRLVLSPGGRSAPAFSYTNMLHKALRHLRRYHRIKQQDLAQQLGISASYLSEIESGAKAHAITVDLLNRYAELFNVPVSSLMLFSEQLSSGKRSEKLRVAMAAKLLKVLDWIDQHADDREAA
jgi:transcriptional regulator with XRE-family HTH domain